MLEPMKTGDIFFCATFVAFFLLAADRQSASATQKEESSEALSFDDFVLKLPIGLPADMFKTPPGNPLTKEKIELGRLLFFDTRLSADDSVSCATCHSPDGAFTDNLPVSVGIEGREGPRNAPTIINRAFSEAQFWDGRAPSLEEQAKGPLINPVEMGMPSHQAVVTKIRAIKGYRKMFGNVFGKDVTIDDLARAIAAFERTIVSGGSALDRYVLGDDNALSDAQKRGFELFRGKARCEQCHVGFNFTDEKFHNIGVGWNGSFADTGRHAVTNNESHTGAFKTPTLRDIAETAPYMHDGSLKTLEEVVEFYDKGGIPNPFLDVEMKRSGRTLMEVLESYEKKKEDKGEPPADSTRLNLTEQEEKDLVEFLKALSGKGWRHITEPEFFPR